jgi:hypothetical protein
MDDREREARDKLIDAARTDVAFIAEESTEVSDSLDRLHQQAYGDTERLRGAAEQLRRRFAGADAIPLLEAAADRGAEVRAEHPPQELTD